MRFVDLTHGRRGVRLLGLGLGLAWAAHAAEPAVPPSSPSGLPQGPGLAARHAGDVGIAADPRVLLAEDFESGELGDLRRRWESVSNHEDGVLSFSAERPAASRGRRSLQMTSHLGRDTGGHLYRRLPRAVETVFARFYVRFEAEAQYVHHFVHLGGYRPATPWPQGGAGDRPRGDERFTVGIEPHGLRGQAPAPGAWRFYPYWSEMKISADGRYWGNSLGPRQPALVPRERWQCVELMLKCNSTPDARDGELALWLDGQWVTHVRPGTPRGDWTGMGFDVLTEGGTPFEGFRWRTHADLKVNFFWLLFYVTENAGRQNGVPAPNPVNRVWFDDLVVATEYVGPLAEHSSGGGA